MRAAWLVVVAACAPRPAEPLAHVGAKDKPTPRFHGIASAARPDVDVSAYLPDLHEDLRWPLTVQQHPMLEPHFPIARELAQPGIAWQQLCTPAVLGRHVVGANANDLMEYLRGWCAAGAGDADGALDHLARVRGSVVNGLAAALVYDVAFVLCEQAADDAERLLDKYVMNDVAILDVLAAAYVEIGRDDDARAINRRAMAFARGKTSETAFCRRSARDVMLGAPFDVFDAVKKNSKDATCIQLVDALRCTHGAHCESYVKAQKLDERFVRLLDSYVGWPERADFIGWRRVVDRLWTTTELPGARELGRAAVRAMARSSDCSSDDLNIVSVSARRFEVTELEEFSDFMCKALVSGD